MTVAGAPVQADTAIRAGSKSFAAASRLFDARTRHLTWALYAWCRHCDDVVDGQELGHGAIARDSRAAALDELRRETERALAGATDGAPPFAGLAWVVRETALPPAFARAHLDGFAMDVAGRRYETLDDTLEYCYHVAGVVGLMMAWLMGVRDEATLLRGNDLGLAFQLTNIARDVGDDAAAGRVYLPATWLRAEGATADASALMTPPHRDALVRVVNRVLDEADRYYASASIGVSRLPFRCAWAVAAARHVYGDIGHVVRRDGREAWASRARTSGARKLARLVQALGEAAWRRGVLRFAEAPQRRGLWTPVLPPASPVIG
jgi:phytoene synthase